jgi:regulator of protease activity HflC (stomatin/prohibitin superfamily)
MLPAAERWPPPWIHYFQPANQPHMNIEPILIFLAVAAFIGTIYLRAQYRHEFIVPEGFAGLLFHEGKLVETLVPGRHIRWGQNYRVTSTDTRRTVLQVAGQEVLTADHVGVKISVTLAIQITDAARTVQTVDNHVLHLYNAVQTAVRTVTAGFTIEALLAQRVAISTPLRELIAPAAEAVGVAVHTIEIRDVMLPGDLRKAFSEVLKAKQEGQAALERARGESAALRNLANAARLIEDQPALATLRFLQTLEMPSTGRTIVMNDLSAFLPARNSRGAKPPESEAEPS